jgi:hypothetical protein
LRCQPTSSLPRRNLKPSLWQILTETATAIIDGWNWYAGTDTATIGSGQYDFQTVITHEIAHSIGLGHSDVTSSVMFPELSTADARRVLLFADLKTAGEDGGAGLHVEALYAANTPGVVTAGLDSRPLSSVGSTGFAIPATSLRSSVKELTSDSSLNVPIASVSHGTDLKSGLRKAAKEIGWRDALESSEVDTLADSQGIDSFFANLADDSDVLDIFSDTATSELWNEMAF